MSASNLGTWRPLGVDAVVEHFAAAPFQWWMSGGHALDLHLGRSWRHHDDTDVGVVRHELHLVHAHLPGWDLQVAAAGKLTPWRGEPLDAALHQNNVWCRATPGSAWGIDLTIGDGTDAAWTYRRDPSVMVPWERAVLRTSTGIPYLAPELQLLYKTASPRPKDDLDAEEVIPELHDGRRARLSQLLAADHPWQDLLG